MENSEYKSYDSYETIKIERGSKYYPKQLEKLGDNAPSVIYAKGNLELLVDDYPLVTVFGTCNDVKDGTPECLSIYKKIVSTCASLEEKNTLVYGTLCNRHDELIMNYVREGGSPAVMLLPYGLDSDDYYSLDDDENLNLTSGIINNVVYEGVAISLWDDAFGYEEDEYLDVLAALATNDIYILNCGDDKKKSAIYFLDKAKELGKNVIINQSAYSQLS